MSLHSVNPVYDPSSLETANENDVQSFANEDSNEVIVQDERPEEIMGSSRLGARYAVVAFVTFTFGLILGKQLPFSSTQNLKTSKSTVDKSWVPLGDVMNNSGVAEFKVLDDDFENLQGLTFDPAEKTLYCFFTEGAMMFSLDMVDTSNLRVSSLVHKLKYNMRNDFPQEIAHIGGVDLVETKNGNEIWLATHTGDKDRDKGYIMAADPETLIPINRTVVEQDFNLDWVAFNKQLKVAFYGTFFNLKQINFVSTDEPSLGVEVPIDFNQYSENRPDSEKVTLVSYIQAAIFISPEILVMQTNDYVGTIHFIEISRSNGDLKAVYLKNERLYLGNEADGISLLGRDIAEPGSIDILSGYNRKHSHEKEDHADAFFFSVIHTRKIDSDK